MRAHFRPTRTIDHVQPSLQEGNPQLEIWEWIYCNRKGTKIPDCRGPGVQKIQRLLLPPTKEAKSSSEKTDRLKTAPERIGSGSFSLGNCHQMREHINSSMQGEFWFPLFLNYENPPPWFENLNPLFGYCLI